MSSRFSRLALGSLAFAAGLVATRADAGIIIMKNGKVFIGRIDPEDDKGSMDDGTLAMHEPKLYKGAPPVHGEQLFQKHDIRWYDITSEEPTDEYMKEHADDPIDQRYQVYIERWRDRKQSEITIDPRAFMPSTGGNKLSPIPIPDKWGPDEISIRSPQAWSKRKVNGIWIFESDQKGTDGFVPRIHVFSVERAVPQISDQLTWVKEELTKLAQADSFDITDGNGPPKQVRNGYDVEWTTTTRRNGRTVRGVRQMHFRDHRTYFVSCYAHEQDFDNLMLLFRACMSSLNIVEAGTATSNAQDRVDTSAVKVGQMYRWKSATNPDQKTWEVTAADATSVTRKVTTTAADGSKKTAESPDMIGSVDPVSRIGSIAGSAGVNPGKVGTEKLNITGTEFDCDIYEVLANGKKYRVWLSKKYPVTIKIVTDGTVQEELDLVKDLVK